MCGESSRCTVSGTENQLEIESERERVVGDTALKSICRDSLAPSSSISWVLCKRLKFTNLRAKAGGQGSARTPSGDRSTGRRRCHLLLCWPGTGEGHICHSPLTWLTNTVRPTSTFPWNTAQSNPLLPDGSKLAKQWWWPASTCKAMFPQQSKPEQVAARLNLHHSSYHVAPSPVPVMTSLGLHHSYYQVALSLARVAASLGLCQSPSQEAPDLTYLVMALAPPKQLHSLHTWQPALTGTTASPKWLYSLGPAT